MTLQGWNPPAGLATIPRGENVYIIHTPAEVTKNNEEVGKRYREITPQNQRTRKPWNNRQLSRFKYWHKIFQ